MSESKKKQSRVPNDDRMPFYYRKIDDIDTNAIGKRLRMIRNSMHLTLDEMSEKLCLSYGGLRKLESGIVGPSARTLILLHENYGVDLVWLLYGRHTTLNDILSGLYVLDERSKFDVFTRLFSYFVTHDDTSLVPGHGRCAGVEHFAKWDSTFYRPLKPEEPADNEILYTDDTTFNYDEIESQIESQTILNNLKKLSSFSPSEIDALARLLNNAREQE